MTTILLVLISSVISFISIYFTVESFREKETRAPKFGIAGAVFHAALIPLILWIPLTRLYISILFGLYAIFLLILLIPHKKRARVVKGTMGDVVGEVKRMDERDEHTVRVENLKPGTERYKEYYSLHPEYKEVDDKRRSQGGFPMNFAETSDNCPDPVSAMDDAIFNVIFSNTDGAAADPSPDTGKAEVSLEKATETIKKFTLHLGASQVGICQANPLWAYSHRAIPEEQWGTELSEQLLPNAVVFTTEMSREHVDAAPYGPTSAESSLQYCNGVYISNILANYFSSMGYRARAQNVTHYDHLMVPLGVDAGLGELGRSGYLISSRLGCRIRVFAVTTDMPLIADKPISVGADRFCRRCKKCATSCPSRSIPVGEKVVHNGIERWLLDGVSCYEFWGKVGTDCAICMSICPFNRPDTLLHRLVRWFVAHSLPAQIVFPHIDNIIYGKKWKPKRIEPWLDYRTCRGSIS